MENGFANPFVQNFSMTSLEKVLKSGNEGKELVENGSEIKRREVIVRGVLSVTVISAEELAPADLMGKADPYVVLIMKKTESKNKTRVYFSLILLLTGISRIYHEIGPPFFIPYEPLHFMHELFHFGYYVFLLYVCF